jgi:mannitol-specific phosphotransferase system IIBC component
MDQTPPINPGTHIAAWGGALLIILANLNPAELVKTIVLAAVGAAVSFIVSKLLHWGLKQYRLRKKGS